MSAQDTEVIHHLKNAVCSRHVAALPKLQRRLPSPCLVQELHYVQPLEFSVQFAMPTLSRLNPMEPDLPRGFQQLNISADERPISRAAKAPHPCGGELKGVSNF